MKRMLVLAGALTVITTGEAAAGGFRVANCQSDGLNYSTQAFTDFASRGMAITRACDPEGDGLRGLVTASSVQLRSVPRGAVAFVNLSAPPGTRFENFTWAGIMSRSDCTYALQLYALVPGVKPISIKNVRANSNCPRTARAQGAAYHSRTFNVNGATRIVQRIICLGSRGRNYCSARGANYILSYKAEVSVVDIAPPTISIIGDTPLARGEWVGGSQPLNYDATDNVGVRNAQVVAAGISGGSDPRACTMASGLAYASLVPCPNGPGHIEVKTVLFPEGTQALVAQAEDTATNVGSAEVTARIDNTPPGRVDVAVQGGDAWRSTNDFVVAWANPPETDRAPIVSAITKLCPVGSGACTSGEPTGADIASFAQPVPAPGEWTLVLWRRDAAGNQTETAASVPVTLRYDPDPPQLGFEASPATDPTLVSVQATDNVSGLADGTIEISREGSNTWQELATQMDGSRLTARIDDAALPEGRYQL
ncbi:MAG: hypothetical protein QOJ29_5482, partial [Thermoleophilaceae bacterium]|nr:hypothetical protein [Thermoleophilaceae bacterium]